MATSVGGVRHVIRDGETGRLCPPGEAEALATALSRTLTDQPAAVSMGAAGRRYAAATFGNRRLVDAISDLYRDLLGGRSRQMTGAPRHRPIPRC